MIFKAQFACSVFIYLAAAAMISAQAQSTVPTNEVIIAQIAQAQAENRTHFRPTLSRGTTNCSRGNIKIRLSLALPPR